MKYDVRIAHYITSVKWKYGDSNTLRDFISYNEPITI